MAIYFVDYENVGSAGIEGIDTLPAGNKVHIFYSVKADTMKMDQVIQLMRVAADVEFHDVTMRGQKNALDFQLIAMLYFTKKDEDTCYIISKDQGYDAAIIFGRKIGAVQVYRRVSINGENIGETKAPQQGRRSGRRGDAVKTGSQIPQQEQPVLLAERAQGVTTLPYQREYIRPPRKEASKAAEPVKKEEPKAAVPVKKEEPKAAEPVKKEEPKAAEPVKKEEPKAAEPVKKEEPKAAEPVKKEEPKAAEPAKKEETKTGIPNFRREVVVVKTVENTGRMQEKAAEPVKKEEPKAAEPVKKEEPKAAEPVKKEEPKAAEPVKKEEPKAAEPVKKEEPEANTPAKQEAAEETGFLKAAAQWDIFQSSIGGLFDYDIPAEFADGEDEPVAIEALTDQKPEAAEPKAESAEPKAEKHSRQRKSRRRSQRQKAEEPVMQDVPKTENAPDTPAVEVKDDAPKASADEPKAEKPKKAAGRKKKEKKTSEETPKTGDNTKSAEKETAAAKDYKEIEKRVAEVMSAAGFALEPEENELIAKALVSSSTKNQFYQFFRKTKGEAAGREFYLKIRGQYESLKVLREA